LSYEGTKLTTG